jgi:hypothetical protein
MAFSPRRNARRSQAPSLKAKALSETAPPANQTLAQEKRYNQGISFGLFSYVSGLFLGATPD